MASDKARIEKLIERYDKKANSNYMAYQQSGMQRHMREYENADELAGFLRRALSSADDHQKMVEYKLELVNFCTRAIRAKNEDDHVSMYDVIKDLASYGIVMLGLSDPYRKEAD